MADVIAYVDGFNLYHGLHSKYGRRYLWLDLQQLARQLVPRHNVVGVRYFTARVQGNEDALARQNIYLRALRAQSGDAIEIVLGRFLAKEQSCFKCGGSWLTYEEKETDVNMAVEVFADTATSASDIALIISADSDLGPAIRRSRNSDPQRGMILAFPPNRHSTELKALIPSRRHIGANELRQSLLPETVTDPTTGQAFTHPEKWR